MGGLDHGPHVVANRAFTPEAGRSLLPTRQLRVSVGGYPWARTKRRGGAPQKTLAGDPLSASLLGHLTVVPHQFLA